MPDQPSDGRPGFDQPWTHRTTPGSAALTGAGNPEPLVSVITAVYNGERFLREAIESVLSQTYTNWEYFLVNDGSTDGSTAIAREAATACPGRIRYLEHPGCENRGMCTSRNLGLAHAQGKYIAILDADDLWFPSKLAEQVALARKYPEAGLIFGHSEYWLDWSGDPNEEGKNYVPPLAPGERLYHPPELMRIVYPLGPCGAPCPSSMLIESALLRRLGGFVKQFDRYAAFEDQAFLAKIYLNAPVYSSSRTWDRYRVHPDSCCEVSKRTGKIAAARRTYFEYLREYLVSQNVTDEIIWQAWQRQTLFYRRPVLHFLQRAAGRMKRTLHLDK